ncbi:hypothetical protein GCM10010177_02280 [Actinomadura citrea]|nr:hypothetical protein GCM10010177_02280 [Actinomadura citrea]
MAPDNNTDEPKTTIRAPAPGTPQQHSASTRPKSEHMSLLALHGKKEPSRADDTPTPNGSSDAHRPFPQVNPPQRDHPSRPRTGRE